MALKNLLPLFFLTLFVAVLAAVGYVVYSIVQDVSKNTREKMERKHVVFSKDGMKVEVKEIKDEEYKDRSQRLVTLSRMSLVSSHRIDPERKFWFLSPLLTRPV